MEPLVDRRIDHWLRKIDDLFVITAEEFDFALWAV